MSPVSYLRSEKTLEEGLRSGNGLLRLGSILGLQTFLFEDLLPAQGLCVRVETEENGLVDEGVLLLRPGTFLDFLAGRADDRLDFVTVDQTGNVWVGDLGGGKEIIFFVNRGFFRGSEDLIKEGECVLRPDDETAEMTTRRELQEVKSPHVNELDTGQVAERLDNTIILIVDNKGATALTMSAVPQLSFTSTEFAGVGDLDDIGIRVKGLEESNSLLGLCERFGGVLDHERDLLDLLDAVTTGKDERWESGSSKSRDNGEAALVLVNLDVPFAPGLGRSEHASSTAHVTEGSLTGAVSSSTTNTGNTCNGATSTPGFGTGLVTSLLAHGICLPLIFRDALVHLLDDIEPDGGGQNRGERKGG